VRLINLEESDKLVAIAKVVERDDEEPAGPDEPQTTIH
jgi:hypothetical protein